MSIKPDPKNANKGTQRGRGMLENSLRQYGAGRSVLADKHGVLIAGNKTMDVAAELGIPHRIIQTDGHELIVVQRTDLDLNDRAAKELAVADNRVGQVSLDWDVDVLAELSAEVDLSGFWNDDELAGLLGTPKPVAEDPGAQVDRADELRQKWQTERGQLWQVGRHRLVCGDSTNADDVARLMAGERADMVFTDPPYNIASHSRNFAQSAPTQEKTYKALAESEWDKDFEIEPALDAILPAMSDDCAVYVCTSQWLVQRIWDWADGWSKFSHYCVWCKPNPAPTLAKRHWTWATELIVYAVRGKHVCNFPNSGHALNWWEITSPSHTTDHPTEKPVTLPTHAIEFSSLPGHIVLDTFLGSGTTLVAAEQTGRVCYGMEIEPKYVAVCLERLTGMGLDARMLD